MSLFIQDSGKEKLKEELKILAFEHYGLSGQIKLLAGESDINAILIDANEKKYTLKISGAEINEQAIDLQQKMVVHLSQNGFPYDIPHTTPNLEAKNLVPLDGDRILRIQQWIEGSMLSEANPRSIDLLQQWGRLCGLLSKTLQGFTHEAAERINIWDPSQCLLSQADRKYINRTEDLECADRIWNRFNSGILIKLSHLRKSINYHDAHDHNIIVNLKEEKARIKGLIDFGDAYYGHTINELAIACAYAAMGTSAPLDAMFHLVESYHKVFPIEDKELEVLFDLICSRLLISGSQALKKFARESR